MGHTHEDIDRLFSVLPDIRTKRTCYLPDEFESLLYEAYASSSDPPTFLRLPFIYGWKAWLEPFLNNITHHSKPRSFHLFRRGSQVQISASSSALINNPTDPKVLLPFPPLTTLPQVLPLMPMPPEVTLCFISILSFFFKKNKDD